ATSPTRPPTISSSEAVTRARFSVEFPVSMSDMLNTLTSLSARLGKRQSPVSDRGAHVGGSNVITGLIGMAAARLNARNLAQVSFSGLLDMVAGDERAIVGQFRQAAVGLHLQQLALDLVRGILRAAAGLQRPGDDRHRHVVLDQRAANDIR